MYGLTSSGFIPKRLVDSKAELEAAFRSSFGAGIKLSDDTVFGKLISIFAERESSLFELAETVYGSPYPNLASDTSLDGVCEITAVSRNGALSSKVVGYLAGTDSTIIPLGSLFAVQDSEEQFVSLAEATLSGTQKSVIGLTRSGSTVTANVTAHAYPVGKRVFMSGSNEAGYNGLVAVATVVDVDNFTYEITTTPATPATGTIVCDPATAVDLESVNKGAIEALSGTLNQIVKSISGLNRVENESDAIKGRLIETDTELRVRRVSALQGLGAARLEAIRGALLQLNNVTEAKIFENETNAIDVDGRPPKSIECLVIGGIDADILSTVWNKKAAGIELFGSVSGTVTDSQSIDHTSKFSRPVAVNIYLEIDLTVDADFPGVSEVESRILAFANTLNIGGDVIVFPYLISSFTDVPGILDLVVRIGTAASPTLDNNIVIPDTQIASFDSSRITLVTV